MSFKDERSSSDLSKKEDISFQAETENNSSKFNFLMVMYEMGRNSYVIHFKQNMVLLSGVWCSYCILWDTERWQSEQVYLLIWQKSCISLYMNFSNQKKSHISISKYFWRRWETHIVGNPEGSGLGYYRNKKYFAAHNRLLPFPSDASTTLCSLSVQSAAGTSRPGSTTLMQ